MSELNLRYFSRKPLYIEAIQVTSENIQAVTDWCNGTLVEGEVIDSVNATAIFLAFIKVPMKKPENVRRTQAYIGDWVLKSTTGFKVYFDRSFRHSFEMLREKACGDAMTTADGMPCVLGEGHRKMAHPIACRSLQDYVEVAAKA